VIIASITASGRRAWQATKETYWWSDVGVRIQENVVVSALSRKRPCKRQRARRGAAERWTAGTSFPIPLNY